MNHVRRYVDLLFSKRAVLVQRKTAGIVLEGIEWRNVADTSNPSSKQLSILEQDGICPWNGNRYEQRQYEI